MDCVQYGTGKYVRAARPCHASYPPLIVLREGYNPSPWVLLIKSYYKITCALYMYSQARSIDTIAPAHLLNITIQLSKQQWQSIRLRRTRAWPAGEGSTHPSMRCLCMLAIYPHSIVAR